ncbi:MAG: metallophosphoesterase family protein [Myxococcota bacterium]
MRLLCLSDIHGHADALRAVLATAERYGYDRVLVAGDLCFPGPEPMETWRRLAQLKAVCVQGVGDRALATVDTSNLHPRDEYERQRLQRLEGVRGALGETVLGRIAKLPLQQRIALPGGRHLALVHGCPLDPTEPMTQDMDDATLAMLLGEETADIVLCGASHVPFDRTIIREKSDGTRFITRIINVGSVGEAPTSETSLPSRFAHATFVVTRESGIDVDQFSVPLGCAA